MPPLALFRSVSHRTWLLILGVLFLAWWVYLAIEPFDRHDWALENALVLVFVLFLGATASRLPLSRISYTLIFLFLLVHEVGAHFTYAKVPYDAWITSWAGVSLNALLGWERNNFDRIVHFLYGLLLAYPIRELYFRVADAEGFWGYFLPLDFTMSTSMLFELFEWGAAELFGGDLGVAYLGTQGDVWDAHKDMALAGLGALIAMLITMALNVYLQKDFAREWSESFRIKHPRPLGEDEIARLWKRRKRS
jgi:putative membrane protein